MRTSLLLLALLPGCGELHRVIACRVIRTADQTEINCPDGTHAIVVDGSQGDTGPTGKVGKDGKLGKTGSTGKAGLPGEAGTSGLSGNNGSNGVQGPSGAAGEQGAEGDQGATGQAGVKGETGDTGVTGAQGPTGSQGLQGEQGEAGPKGEQGVAGVPGEAGLNGANGTSCSVSETGSDVTIACEDGSEVTYGKPTADMSTSPVYLGTYCGKSVVTVNHSFYYISGAMIQLTLPLTKITNKCAISVNHGVVTELPGRY